MKAEERLWRTGDGRLVADGDLDAAFLAYTAGDEIAPADQDRVPGVAAEDKQRATPANKARQKAADK